MKNKFLGLMVLLSGCGIKGDPLPPDQPPALSRSRTLMQKSKEMKDLPALPPVKEDEEKEE